MMSYAILFFCFVLNCTSIRRCSVSHNFSVSSKIWGENIEKSGMEAIFLQNTHITTAFFFNYCRYTQCKSRNQKKSRQFYMVVDNK